MSKRNTNESDRYEDLHKEGESVVTKFLQGQIRSRLTCQICWKEKNNFEMIVFPRNHLMQNLMPKFKEMDKNKDGVVEVAELRSYLTGQVSNC